MSDSNTSLDTTATDAVAPAAPPSITINDMKNVLMVIDVCTQRGAFRGNELTSIGMLHDKVSAFVADAEAQQAAAAAQTDAPLDVVTDAPAAE